jgi:hypothetical protein
MDSDMASRMALIARAGHPCGEDFHATEFLAQHPEFAWQAPLLRDMKAGPWTEFKSGDREIAQNTGIRARRAKVILRSPKQKPVSPPRKDDGD